MTLTPIPHASAAASAGAAPPERRGAGAVPTELLFREINEELSRPLEDGADASAHLVVLCECERARCRRTLRLTRARYEEIRRFPTRFLMCAGHAGVGERIVATDGALIVVEKTGARAQIAIRLDPRRRCSVGS